MNTLRVGLLPLYVKLYDEVLPDLAAHLEPFVNRVQNALQAGGLEVVGASTSRTRPDFARAVAHFEAAAVDAIVTLHLAYSPSLESAEVLGGTALPIIMLDTTPDVDFGRDVDPRRLLFNHGVHGVQDLASVLRRLGKPFQVVAGHLDEANLIPRVVNFARSSRSNVHFEKWMAPHPASGHPLPAPLTTESSIGAGRGQGEGVCLFQNEDSRAARAARCLRSMRVLRVGGRFPGMGDFAVGDEVLQKRLGITVGNLEPAGLAADVQAVREGEVAAEMATDAKRFRVDCGAEAHARSVRVGLGLRRHLERGGYGAFSLNFLAFQDGAGPVNTVPFLECCQAMARGLGYAGEGDALTAALVGALLQGFGATTFTEIFCADWAGDSLFLSHMGEWNAAEMADLPLLYEKEYPFTPALNPVTLAGCPRPGPGLLVNLAPGPDDTFRLITAPVEVLGDGTHPDLHRWVRAWIRPRMPVARFLEDFSHLGGTHHSALMFGDHAAALAAFAAFLKIEHCPLG